MQKFLTRARDLELVVSQDVVVFRFQYYLPKARLLSKHYPEKSLTLLTCIKYNS